MSGVAALESALGASIVAMIDAYRARRGPATHPVRVLGLGWATVELERATRDLARRLPASAPFGEAPADTLLGAACLVGAPVALAGGTADPVRIVLLEPSTEGRLAASLARRGEGPAVLWLVDDDGPQLPLSRPGDGPFGGERLVLGGAVDAPLVLVVPGGPGTIEA
jgi:hypothetical protein